MTLQIERRINLGFALAVALLLALAAIADRFVVAFNRASDQVEHSQVVMRQLEVVWSQLQDVRIDSRDFSLSGDPRFRASVERGIAEEGEQLRRLRVLTADSSLRQAQIDQLTVLVQGKVASIRRDIETIHGPGPSAAFIAGVRRRAPVDPVAALIAAMKTDEGNLLTARLGAARTRGRRAVVVLAAGFAADFALLGAVFAMARRNLGAKEKAHGRLRALFESLPGLYLILNPDWRIVTASDAYLKATMTERAKIVGRGIFEVFPDNPDDANATGAANLRSSLERVRQTGTADTMAIQRYDVRRTDGTFEERFWSPVNSPLFEANGRLEYIIHRVEDVTDFMRKMRSGEAEQSDLTARMQQMEAEVYRSAQEVQVVNQQLRDANAELEAFSYSVSHDLRAPLRHVQGYVEMLTTALGEPLSDKAARYLRTIKAASGEMGQLIDDLLAFSRMSRSEMRESRVDLDTLVRDTVGSLELALRDRPIEWKIDPLPAVAGDAAMIKQVYANLLGNAVKYSRPRKPARIEVGRAGEEDGRVILFVRDNGVGFDMQYAQKLFGVFQRLHRAEEFEGTGIGLATVQRIVVRHGGRIWAESQPGNGATFYFTLKSA
jgi:signal transduction histidine kinase/CHASE3 domain sensor protein